jgi:hypothetical protein
MVAVVVLPLGEHPLALVVSDGLAACTNTVTVAVLTTAQGTQRLISLVDGANLLHPRPLLATLEAALASIQRGNRIPAASQLRAFQNQVRAQVSSEDPPLADTLIQAAQQVMEALDTGSNRAVEKIQ